ncbi:chromate efflux transporter [Herbaspirillum sp. WKF16]|uniref:chromate efflux transporter n=1 Tax=Herbaspirillum sp. WKF16 TaxID=3028312 RepID=UPI0023A9233A|nr:chromate efflux transporter [Herbaspirillum sp. WKF16]WDZ94103.1 chromate efflux transporter [Herbaspirillum sp. WKF16]
MSAAENNSSFHLPSERESLWALFLIFLRLGLTSFGGPVAHLGYFREEFVSRRQWLSERSFTDLVGLCQFLPGPASSQVGMAIGMLRGGYSGALVSWAGFTLPSATALILFAAGISLHEDTLSPASLHGLKVVAVAVVAQAVWGMGRAICIDVSRIVIMVVAACACLAFPGGLSQIAIILLAAIAGLVLCGGAPQRQADALPIAASSRSGLIWLAIFLLLLIGLPIVSRFADSQALSNFDAFFRVGSLVFGGGHVVLPLLQAEVVPNGLVGNDTFLAGYGITQAMPGPLFTFTAFLGASMTVGPTGLGGGLLCLFAIFLPSFLLVAGTIPFWNALRRNAGAQASLGGVNSAVVGMLLAALYDPVWIGAIHHPSDFALALTAFVALSFGKAPPWLVVMISAIAGPLIEKLA